MQKIILFYQFTPVSDPEALMLWQQSLASSLNLKGRIILSTQGINGSLGGELNDLKAYVKHTKAYPKFKTIVFKWSEGLRDDFPRLSVKVRPELVTFGVSKLPVNNRGIIGGGKRLSPGGLHNLIESKKDDVVFVDGRNVREAAIGRFKDALVMPVNHTRDFPKELTKKKYEPLKSKTVVTYCTGGIRCEVLSKLMLDAGYRDVYQLDGGIVRYLDEFGDRGLWEGSLFVFDRRMSVKTSDQAKTISRCVHCKLKTANYVNCANLSCNELILACIRCCQKTSFCPNCKNTKLVKYSGAAIS